MRKGSITVFTGGSLPPFHWSFWHTEKVFPFGGRHLMSSSQSYMSRAAFWLAGGSAVAVVFSIAASTILLGAALIALLFSDLKLRLPPIWLQLGLFMAAT